MNSRITWSVFSKPWPLHSAQELADVVLDMGFTGIELPVRDNTFVTPGTALASLPGYVAELRDRGVETVSIAADLSEEVFAACERARVPLIRIMVPVAVNDYAGSVDSARAMLQESAKWAKQYGVGVAIQPHHGAYVSSSLGVMELLADLPAEHFGIAWDAAHDALAGDDPVTTLGMAEKRVAIANFKNVRYVEDDFPARTGTRATWKPWFVQGHEGLADWQRALQQLRASAFTGPICLTAQYSASDTPISDMLRKDLRFAQNMWNG